MNFSHECKMTLKFFGRKTDFSFRKIEIPMIKCAGFSEYFPPPHTHIKGGRVPQRLSHTVWKEKEEKLLHII